MGKTSKRVWSLVLSILMVLSMASVFCLPTMAAASNELDYDALRTGADTFVINKAWTADDLVAGNTVSYYFKGQTYEETYDANRHFASWADCYAVYSSKINETNIGSYVPTFIFAPGTYTEQILLHTNANILGSNAGINPSDPGAEWTLSAMNEGWAKNPAWDASKETVINAEILLTGRNSKAQQNSDSSGNYVAAQADAYWQYYLEKYDAANGKTAFVNVIDGVALASDGCYTASYYDIGYKAFNKDGSDSVTATGSRNVDTYFQNGYFRSPGKFIAKYWDSARNISSAHLINMRLEGNTVNGLFQKYMKSVEFDGCYFTGFKGALFGASSDNMAFGYTNNTGIYTSIHTEQSIVMKNSVFYNNDCWGWLATGIGKNILNGIGSVKQVMTVENNIFHNATMTQGMWGVFVPYNTNPACTIELNILNNQFVQTSDVSTLSSLINLNYDYQQAPVNITVRENKFIGNMNLIGNKPDDTFTADKLAVLKGSLRLDYGDNFWADTEADVGKPITHLNGSTSGGYANGFDFADATYYFDSAMTISSAALNITAVEGLGDTVTVGRDSITAMCSGATGKVTPVFTVAEGSTTAIFTDAECTQEISEIDYDAIENKDTFYVKVTVGEFSKVYSLTITTAIVKEFSEAMEAGEIEGFDYDTTFVYVPAEDGQTVYSFWDGEYYGFTVDNEVVYNSLSAIKGIVNSESFGDATGKVILPGFEYGRLTVDFPAEFYGTNYKVNPINKPETVSPTLWTLSENWDTTGATGVKGITVPAGFAGKVVFNGIELRDKYDASGRNSADACADVTFNNVVVDFKNIPGYNYSLEFGGKDGRPAADAFRLHNVFFKNLGSSGNRRFISEGHPSIIDVDNMFWDGLVSSTNGAAGWAKNNGNRNLSYSVKNSMIANIQVGTFFQFEPQNDVAADSAQEYTVDFANNIFINENERAAGTTFLSFNAAVGKRFTGISITGNTFYNANGKSIAIGANNASNFDGINEANKLRAENVVVDNNNFIGCVNDQFAIGKFNALTNSFRTADMNTDGAVGVGTGYDKDGVYFVDMARTAKNTDMEIVSVDAGTSQAEGITFDKAARTLNFRLLSGSTEGMNIVLPEGATGKWVDAQGNESAVVNFTDLTELSSVYKYVVTNKGYDYPYAVEIVNYEPKDFVGNYVCESGLISDKALLVTPLAADLASGAKLSYKWDGMVYDFYAGTNAFATLDDALSYAGANDIEVPEVLLTYWADPGVNLEINRAVKIFAPNYNTKPYIGTLDENNPATATNGENWVENPEFMANQVVVSHIVIGADVSTKEVAIYGLTMTNRFLDTARAVSEAATKISLVNTMMNAPTASNYLFDVNNANARTETQIDELYVKNLYIKATGGASRLIGENVTCKTTFDGLWMDAKVTKFDQQCAYIKCNAKDYTFTIKNSNLRNFNPTSGIRFFQFQGYIGDDNRIATEEENRWLVFENNILDQFYMVVGGKNIRYMFKWFPAGYNGLKFNNNYMACPPDDTGSVNFFHSVIPTPLRTEENMEKVKVSVEITGNVFNGYSSDLAISDGGNENRYPNATFDIANNFWVVDYAEDLDSAVGNMPSISKYCHRNTEIGNFWLDRAMTKPSNQLYEYTLTNDNAKYFANTASKVLKYKLDENDEKVTVEETTDGFKYTVDMSGFVSENVYNSISLVNGEQSADISEPLVFTLAEKADSLKLNLTVSSPDMKSVTETYTLYIASEFKDAGIDSVTVGDSDVAFSADKNAYAVILPADGENEAITVTPSAGSEATVTDAEGNVVTAVGADVKCTPVEYTITVSNADSTETFTLSVVREHRWNEGEVTTAPTCTEKGVKTFTCLDDETHTYTEELDVIDHDLGEFVTDKEPTCTEKGSKSKHCSMCGEKFEVTEIDMIPHTWNDGEVTKAPTCSAVGEKTFTCSVCQGTKTEEIAIDPDAHEWDTEFTVDLEPTCSAPGSKSIHCKHNDEHRKDVTAIEADASKHVWDEGVVTTAPTCSATGVKTFTCSACQQTKTEEIAIDPNAHDYDVVTTPATCEQDGSIVKTCKHDSKHVETTVLEKLGHDWNEGEVTTAPTCEEKGVRTFTCKNDPTHTKTEEIAALGHKWDDGVVTKAATCTEKGEKTFTCSVCQGTKTEEIAIDPNAHDYDVVTTPATCEKDGSIVKTCKHNAAHVETEVLEAIGHDWDEGVVTTEPTCEEKGVRTFTCKNDETHTKTEEIAALGHKWDDGAVTKAPTCSAVGEKTFTCSVCQHTRTEEIAVDPEAHKWGEYVYNNDATTENDGTKTRKCELCGKEETVVAEGTKLEPEVKPIDSNEYFPDIKADRENRDKDRWYKPYVDYVATYKLMNGMKDGTFAPNNVLTRAEFAQILANMSGVDTSNRDVTTQFTDVPAGKWYSAAIKWAVENGIVKGVTDTTFDPNAKIQRQHVCLMLVRYAEKFGIELEAINEKVTFADDAEIGNSSKDAVYACQQAGIVTGKTETTFAPKDSATRAEIATFITRYHKIATAK